MYLFWNLAIKSQIIIPAVDISKCLFIFMHSDDKFLIAGIIIFKVTYIEIRGGQHHFCFLILIEL